MNKLPYKAPKLMVQFFNPQEYCTPCETDLVPFTTDWGNHIFIDYNNNESYNAGEFYSGTTNETDGKKKGLGIYELLAKPGEEWNKLETLPSLADGTGYTGGQFQLLIDGYTEEVPLKFNKLGTADLLVKDGVAYRNHS